MKRMIPLFVAVVAAILIASCTNTKKDDNANNGIQTQDTAGLAEYQRWKMENEIRARQAETAPATPTTMAPAAPVRSAPRYYSGRSSSSRSTGTYRSGSSAGTQPVASAPAPAPRRKGMSHTAKGAIVGAASGAIIGAVANKNNRLGGGVVGGVIGAAAGAGIGAIVDKKERQRGY